jgi:hypothetical protein
MQQQTKLIRATIRPIRGKPVTLSFKGCSQLEVRKRVSHAGLMKFPQGFTFTVREA